MIWKKGWKGLKKLQALGSQKTGKSSYTSLSFPGFTFRLLWLFFFPYLFFSLARFFFIHFLFGLCIEEPAHSPGLYFQFKWGAGVSVARLFLRGGTPFFPLFSVDKRVKFVRAAVEIIGGGGGFRFV